MDPIRCSCGGEFESCFKCGGSGWVDEDYNQSEPSRSNLPPVRADLGQFRSTSLSVAPGKASVPPLQLRQVPGVPPVAVPRKAKSKSPKAKKSGGLAPKIPVKRHVIKPYTVVRIQRTTVCAQVALDNKWVKPDQVLSPKDRFNVKLKVEQVGDNAVLTLLDIERKPPKGQSPVAKHPIPAKGKAKGAPKPNSHRAQKTAKAPQVPVNPAMMEAFKGAIEANSDQDHRPDWNSPIKEIPERQLDATKDYWRMRDHGSFGSHPSHDDFDE
jgi:hypothetical protein